MPTSAQELARRWVDDDLQTLPAELPAATQDLAQALKDEAVAAWGTVPVRALRCAALLAQLRGREDSAVAGAMADWAAGLAALTQGRLAEAGAGFDAAHAALQALGRHHEAAQTRVPRMIVFSMLGLHDEALACGETALSSFVDAGDERSAGKVELNLGTMQSRRYRHVDAEALYRRASVRAARAGDRELSIRADIALANALTWQHAFDEAQRVNERARMRARTHGFAVLTAHAQSAIGRIELLSGRYASALRTLAGACADLRASGASQQHVIDAEVALADAYRAVNLLPEARDLFDAVVRDAAAIGARTEEATALIESARVAQRMGGHETARAGFERARALFEEEGNEGMVAWADLSLAALQLQQGQADDARARAADAAGRLEAAAIPGWALEARALEATAAAQAGDRQAAQALYGGILARTGGLGALRWSCLGGLGELAWHAKDLAGARGHFEAALAGLDDTRATLPGDEFRTAFGADAESIHDRLVQIDRAAGKPPAELLATIERGRAAALALAEAESRADVQAGAPQTTALRWIRQRRHESLAAADAEEARRLAAEESRLERELLESRRRAQLMRDPASATAGAPAFEAQSLQASLRPDQAVVVYHVSGDAWLACVVTAEGVHAVALDGGVVAARLRGVRLQLDALRVDGMQRLRGPHGALLMQRARHHLQGLHAALWAPLAEALGGRRRVVVVPHGPLHYVPFAALHDGRDWLVQRHEVSLAPCARWAAQALAARPATPRRALALGFHAGELGHVDDEVAAVTASFADARLLLGAQATQAALREAAPDADVVHLACHAQFRADNPMFSALELADGPLALHEAPSLGLRAQLVTLSACETGISHIAPGNEAIGLVRGFLLAGVRSVLASGWAVDDAATAELMGDFYARLGAGDDAAVALAAAQRQRAQTGAHPFHWAAFSLHGRG